MTLTFQYLRGHDYGFSSIELRAYKSDSRVIVNSPTEPILIDPVPSQPIPQDTTPEPTPEPIVPDEDAECRSVSSYSSRQSSASKKLNSEPVGEFFEVIDFLANVKSHTN